MFIERLVTGWLTCNVVVEILGAIHSLWAECRAFVGVCTVDDGHVYERAFGELDRGILLDEVTIYGGVPARERYCGGVEHTVECGVWELAKALQRIGGIAAVRLLDDVIVPLLIERIVGAVE